MSSVTVANFSCSVINFRSTDLLPVLSLCDRSSITRLSVDQKQILVHKNAEDERAHLHSVLGQVSEDVVIGIDANSEAGPGRVDIESDSAPTSPKSLLSPTSGRSESASGQENGGMLLANSENIRFAYYADCFGEHFYC